MSNNKSIGSTSEIFVIGSSYSGEFGLGHTNELDQLTKVTSSDSSTNITQIYSGYSFAIYADSDHKILFAAGSDTYYQCAIGHIHDNSKLTPITYFNQRNINIEKIFVNITSECSFWMTDKKIVYGIGRNDNGQLGIGNTERHSEPVCIASLSNVIDIQSSEYYSLALCESYNDTIHTIICYWCRIYNVPNDISNLIAAYNKYYTVYSTEYSEYGGNGRKQKDNKKEYTYEWAEIETFKNRDIIQIRIGDNHSLFLESNGTVYSCGYNSNGELGLCHTNNTRQPEIISYFVENNIKIKSIECGSSHCLALSYDNKVYAFGDNEYKQCAHPILDTVHEPVLIEYFKGMQIEYMQCGVNHSHCMTSDGKHYLFGRNYNNECIFFQENQSYCKTPHCINEIIKQQCKKKTIQSISMGYDNTKVIVMC